MASSSFVNDSNWRANEAASSDSEDLTVLVPDICGDGNPFIDPDLMWYTDRPDLTPCFRKSVLMWTPCAFFWLMLPIRMRTLFRSPSMSSVAGETKLTTLSLSRALMASLLAVIGVMDTLFWALREGMAPVDVADPLLRTVTFCAVTALVFAERRRGFRTSWIQFLFWLTFLLSGTVQAYSFVRDYWQDEEAGQAGGIEPTFTMVTFFVSLALILASFVSHFFVDAAPTYSEPNVAAAAPSCAQEADEVDVESRSGLPTSGASSSGLQCPKESASFPAILTFSWFTSLAWTGFKRSLTMEDLWELPRTLKSATLIPKFQRHFEAASAAAAAAAATRNLNENGDVSFATNSGKIEIRPSTKKGTKSSPQTLPDKQTKIQMLPILARVFGGQLFRGSIIKLFHDMLIFASPLILKSLIRFTAGDEEVWKGISYAIILFVVNSTHTICLSQYFYEMYAIGIAIRTSVISAIYRKSLRVSAAGKKESTTGEVVNLMSVDTQKLVDLMPYFNMIWSSPLQILFCTGLLWNFLGPSVLAGLLVMVLLIPVNFLITVKSRNLQIKQMKEKDERVKMMNEIMQGMKILKLYAWEPSFQNQINNIRDKEIYFLKQIGYLAAGTSFVWSCAPFVVSLVTFATYTLSDPNNILDSEKAFVSLSLFNILRFPMSMLPMMITSTVQAIVSIKRIDKFLNADELKGDGVVRLGSSPPPGELDDIKNGTKPHNSDAVKDVALEVTSATFKWDLQDEKPCLDDISLQVQKGSLVAVVGQVGSGKSSLLSAMLGEMLWIRQGDDESLDRPVAAPVVIRGSIAYSAQHAWIRNATLRDNILFNKKFVERLYTSVIEACALVPDLEILGAGDKTEIGEKGINLSGGQKHRVALARAVYADADIYLLDDPLSAVDAHVGKHIFEKVIGPNGLLANKTRVLVTHGVTHLPLMDNIVVMKDGKISEIGTYKELLARKGAFADFLVQYLAEASDEVSKAGEAPDRENATKLEAVGDTEDAQILSDLASTIGKEELESKLRQGRRSGSRQNSQCSDEGSGRSGLGSLNNSRSNLNDSSSRKTSTSGASPVKRSRKISTVSDSSTGKAPKSATVNGVKASGAAAAAAPSAPPSSAVKQYEAEKSETGKVPLKVYWFYLISMSWKFVLACISTFVIQQAFSAASSIWLSMWSDSNTQHLHLTHHHPSNGSEIYYPGANHSSTIEHEEEVATMMNGTEDSTFSSSSGLTRSISNSGWSKEETRDLYLGVYGGLGLGQAVAVIIASTFLYLATLNASRRLHCKVLSNVLKSPMEFFDTTPQGRILNRFSKDIDVLDAGMPMILRGWITTFLGAATTFVIIAYTTPLFILPTVFILGFYYIVQKVYVASSRQLKRLESVSRSPIFSHFGETITGAGTIRAYGMENFFIRHSEAIVDKNHQACYPGSVANRWLSVRLETVGNLITFFASLLAVFGRDSLSPGLVGLSLSYALSVTQTLNWFVRMTGEVETNIVTVERLKEYTDMQVEAPWRNPEGEKLSGSNWPKQGNIKLDKLSVRYRKGLDLVLKQISLDIKGGEKIGVVGRTGAGKSSLTMALFRIVEAAEGTITIDGVDIATLGLHDLRSKLAIIPQDPVLFSGTLRVNLDPFNDYDDEALWEALKLAHLESFASSFPEGLNHKIAEGGENISVGQRQLVCLARALLRKSKILVLDEATAAVDLETDELIQATIRKEFADCTIITIAHRLNTILDYTKILVLKQGEVAEFDSPSALLEQKSSLFYAMCKDAGLTG